MDRSKQEEIAQYLNGSAQSEGDAAERFNCTTDEVLAAVVECGVELCSICGWWGEADEMEVVDTDMVCADCLDHPEDEE